MKLEGYLNVRVRYKSTWENRIWNKKNHCGHQHTTNHNKNIQSGKFVHTFYY